MVFYSTLHYLLCIYAVIHVQKHQDTVMQKDGMVYLCFKDSTFYIK